MFCGNCGAPTERTRFCTKCGSALPALNWDDKDTQAHPNDGGRSAKSNIPDIESSPSILRKADMGAYCAGELPQEYAWLNKPVDVVLGRNSIVVVSAAPVNRFTRAADNVAVLGMAGSLVGATVVSLPAAIIGAAYEGFFGEHNNLDRASLQALFESGNAVWISKADAEFYFIELQGGFFGDSGCLYAVIGEFETANGKLKMAFSGSDYLYAIASTLRKAFQKPGYPFRNITGKKDRDLLVEFDRVLMANFPGTAERFTEILKIL